MLTASLFVRDSYAISMPVYSFLLRSANKTNIRHRFRAVTVKFMFAVPPNS